MSTYNRPTGVPAPERTKQGNTPTYLVPFLPGDGGGAVLLTVAWADDFLHGPDGTCAFCHHDTASWDDPTTLIGDYLARHTGAATCPNCQGRPA